MTVILLLFMLWMTQRISASNNFYFATHASYTNSTLDSSIISSTKMAGDLVTVTQQCRRNCAQNLLCKAFDVTLLQGQSSLGLFNCRYFEMNACNWTKVSLQSTLTASSMRLWEKLEAAEGKPKPCVEYCAVKHQGNCTACRGYAVLTGIDCDVAPKLCSGYPTDDWLVLPIWPWGFYGRQVEVICINRQIALFTSSVFNDVNFRILNSGSVTGLTNFTALVAQFDWNLISELQTMSANKTLTAYLSLGSGSKVYHFTGLEISPIGELSLNASTDSPPSTGFPVPLSKVPFVSQPALYSSACGPFWQFQAHVSVCQQSSNLLSYDNMRWEGTTTTFNFRFAALAFA